MLRRYYQLITTKTIAAVSTYVNSILQLQPGIWYARYAEHLYVGVPYKLQR